MTIRCGLLAGALCVTAVAQQDARIVTTPEGQIVVELGAEDIVPANLFDLDGSTLVFTPDGRGAYSRSVGAVAWEEDIGDPVGDRTEVEFLGSGFPFAGRRWESFFVSRYGLVTFGQPFAFSGTGPSCWGTMEEIAELFVTVPTISGLYKPMLGGLFKSDARRFVNTQHVARRPDRVVITWTTSDPKFYVYGRPPRQHNRFQAVLHGDGRIVLNYQLAPSDPDEAIRDGVTGVFPNEFAKGELIARISDREQPDLPAHVDLVEAAIYASSVPGVVIAEFTTRGPIPEPGPGEEYVFSLLFDADEPFFTRRDNEDLDFNWRLVIRAGELEEYVSTPNRVSMRVTLREHAGIPVRVAAAAASRTNGSWDRWNGWTRPVLARLPDGARPVSLSSPECLPSARQVEVFHYQWIRDIRISHAACSGSWGTDSTFSSSTASSGMMFKGSARRGQAIPGPSRSGGLAGAEREFRPVRAGGCADSGPSPSGSSPGWLPITIAVPDSRTRSTGGWPTSRTNSPIRGSPAWGTGRTGCPS